MTCGQQDRSSDRVVVFIDAQNLYNDTRRAFGGHGDPATMGQVDPMKLAYLLASKRPAGVTQDRSLGEVRVYRGRPDPRKEPKTYGPHMRQCSSWQAAGATVIARSLRYPDGWPTLKPEEKGIDVQIAVDMVTMAINRELDVAILVSTDTDLIPALEAYSVLPTDDPPVCEVTAWRATGKQLRVKGEHLWCHFLEHEDYLRVRDRRDYNVDPRR